MVRGLRSIRCWSVVFVLFVALANWACSEDPEGISPGEECTSDAECQGDLECIDGTCGEEDFEPDAGTDADPGEPDADAGPTDPDADVGEDAGDEDTGPEPDPDCPDPITCDDKGFECGTIGDGCGNAVHCGACDEGEICGTDEEHAGQCVDLECTPVYDSCEEADVECGSVADGCGDTLDCGSCGEGEVCGTGANAGKCVSEDCDAASCAELTDVDCGIHPDGCGGIVDCDGCGEGERCEDNQCEPFDCEPDDCSDLTDVECGIHPDGCGGTVDCDTCSGDDVCDDGECVDPGTLCNPLGCEDYGDDINCGVMSDGCGGLTDVCGECEDPEICGGGGIPNVCGAQPGDDDECVNLCEDQAVCTDDDPEDATTLTGTVYAPDGELPIPNAHVYVPNDPIDELPEIQDGPVCEQCEDQDLGNPLVGTNTEYDGTFELRHVPADTEFPLVIKIGQWRRVVTVDPVDACEKTELSDPEDTRLPRTQHETGEHDNIPMTAVSTGAVDAMECVLLKMGIDEDEFSRHSEDGRIHLYRANGGVADTELAEACGYDSQFSQTCWVHECTDRYPQYCGDDADGDMLRDNLSHNLYQDQDKLNDYDMIVTDCQAFNFPDDQRSDADHERMREYLDSGGRLFASHFNYNWLYDNEELDDPVVWDTTYDDDEDGEEESEAFVDIWFGAGQLMWDWMVLVDDDLVGGGDPEFTVIEPRHHAQAIDDELATQWIYTDESEGHYRDAIQQLTFETPVEADEDEQCGQVAYSAFHVAETQIDELWEGPPFPDYCYADADLTTQEKTLAYRLFDLAACVTEDDEPPEPTCEPLTCEDYPDVECGFVSDGCGGSIECGTCPDGSVCGGDGEPNQCSPECEPLTCEDHDAECGTVVDGCGGTAECGPCEDADETCGGGGEPNQCGCEPLTCEDHDADCGIVDDGCGGTDDCGECPDDQICGGDGPPNQCSADCIPLTCDDHEAECGTVTDGCGDTIDCGDCPDPDSCGVGGEPNVCDCIPLTCDDHDAECGTVADGCGETLECGECPGEEICQFNECVEEQCRALGEPCTEDSDCCSESCFVPDGEDEGECVSG